MRHNSREWAEYLKCLGNGQLNDNQDCVELRHVSMHQHSQSLIETIYPDISTSSVPAHVTILAPLNTTVDNINNAIIKIAPGTMKSYVSVDTPLEENNRRTFPTEFLNRQESGCLPPHKLDLKVGAPIIVMRNIRPPHIVNGMRGVIIHLFENVLEIRKCNGDTFFLPRISIVTSDSSRKFIFKRRQFPIKLFYAMTLNRAEGQTLQRTGIDLT